METALLCKRCSLRGGCLGLVRNLGISNLHTDVCLACPVCEYGGSSSNPTRDQQESTSDSVDGERFVTNRVLGHDLPDCISSDDGKRNPCDIGRKFMGHFLVRGIWNNGPHRIDTAPFRSGNEVAPGKIRQTVRSRHASLEADENKDRAGIRRSIWTRRSDRCFGEYLRGMDLDSVIAHELGHVQGHHTRKRILVLACVVAAIAFLSLGVAFATPPYRAMFMTFSLLAIVLVNSYTSRRFEYACDQKAAEFTQSPQSVIRALVVLYKKTNSPETYDRIIELFRSHPSLVHRVQAIAKASGLPTHKVSEFLSRTN